MGQFDEAEAAYRRAIELRPGSWANHNYLGAYFFGRGRLAEARAEFQRAVTLAPDNPRAWSNLGGVATLEGRWEEAESALRSALRVAPYGPALSNLGTLQFRQRRLAEAARTFEQAAQVSPRNGYIRRNLAASYYWAPGERHRAADAYRQAAALLEEERGVDPENPGLLVLLADCYAMLGQADLARRLAREALALNASADDVATVVAVYEQLGERVAALRQVRAALRAGYAPSEFEVDPALDGLRQDPRYGALVRDAGKGGQEAR